MRHTALILAEVQEDYESGLEWTEDRTNPVLCRTSYFPLSLAAQRSRRSTICWKVSSLATGLLLVAVASKFLFPRQLLDQAALRPGDSTEYASVDEDLSDENSTFVNESEEDEIPSFPQQMFSGVGGFFSNLGNWFSNEEQQVFHSYPTTTSTSTVTRTTSTATTTTVTTTTVWLPTLFCFEVLRKKGYEREVVEGQEKRRASIFSCDEHMLLSSDGAFEVGNTSVTAIPVRSSMQKGVWGQGDMTTNSWMNTEVFINAWDLVLKENGWWRNDWTVKVDPDAVFFPHRLQVILKHRHNSPAAIVPPTFFANCDLYNKLALYGALEVVSQNALGVYYEKRQECKNMNWHGWGEDFWLETCLGHLGANKENGVVMMADDRCHGAPCTNHHKVAFHDFKNPHAYFECWEKSRKSEMRYNKKR